MSTTNLLPVDYVQRRWQRRPNMICMILFSALPQMFSWEFPLFVSTRIPLVVCDGPASMIS